MLIESHSFLLGRDSLNIDCIMATVLYMFINGVYIYRQYVYRSAFIPFTWQFVGF